MTARYTPPEAIETMFTPGQTTSRCIDNARTTHDLARQVEGFEEANLFIAHRGECPAVEHVDRAGKVRVLPVRPRLSKTVTSFRGLGKGRAGRQNNQPRTRPPGLEH